MRSKKKMEQHFGLTYLATGDVTNGAYFLAHMLVPAGDSGPPAHIHEREDEGFHMIDGELIFAVDGEEVVLRTGEFLNIEKGERHSWRNVSNSQASLLVIFSPAGIEGMFRKMEDSPERLVEIGEQYGTRFSTD